MINNGPVSWSSHKQSTVAISTMEAEYMALSEAGREAIARTHLFDDLLIQLDGPPGVLSDNQGALTITTDPVHHQRAKHIATRYHHIRHLVQENQIALGYVPSAQQTADILTKALHFPQHLRCVVSLGLTKA